MPTSHKAPSGSRRRPSWVLGSLAAYIVLAAGLGIAVAMKVSGGGIGGLWMEGWGIGLLVVPPVLLGLWYRSAARNRNRVSDLENLYSLTVRLSRSSDAAEIVEITLSESMRVLGASYVQVRLPQELGGTRCRLESGRVVRDGEPAGVLEQEVAAGRGVVLVHRDEPGWTPDRADGVGVAVPLGELDVAVMTAGHPAGRGLTFDDGDLRFLEAVAANLGTALLSSQRLERLRQEVAAREHQALHDSLTGLANRVLFGRWVGEALEDRSVGRGVGVLLMDLDGFKDVNDTLGHHTGDAVLQEVAKRVLASVGKHGQAARLGGDEFAFLIRRASSTAAITEIATAVRQCVSRPVRVGGMVLEVRASVGVAVAPEDGTDVSTLLRRADVAMYAAKTRREGVVTYNRDIDVDAKRRLVLTNELRQSMAAGEIEIWYQPMARLGTGEITGMEALLRWRHRDYGPIPPTEFIPVAEQSGLIEPLTWWVLESSLSELARWRGDGFDLTMAVNVSARSLIAPHVQERLRRLLGRAGIPAADLTLEITESLMMADPDRSARVLDDLAALGVRIAIDDFGTGYSSLSRLKRLPVETVKIDRSFVMSMHRDEGDEAIVRATIELAKNMGHEVIAEGVERQDTWDRLATLGCDLVQGHILAPAMPIDVCRQWLTARQSPRLATIRSIQQARGA